MSNIENYKNLKMMLSFVYNNDIQDINSKKLNNLINESYYDLLNKGYSNIKLTLLSLLCTYYKLHDKEKLFNDVLNNYDIVLRNRNTNDIIKDLYNENVSSNINGRFVHDVKDIDFNKKLVGKIDKKIIVGTNLNNIKKSDKSLLEDFTHEFNHAMSNINNSYKFINDNYYVRVGLNDIHYKKDDITSKNYKLNEFYNVFITDKIINEIIKYKNYDIKNKNISNFLNNINDDLYISKKYLDLRIVCMNLFFNEELIRVVEEVTYNGNTKEINKFFDSKNVNYEEFSNVIDNLNECCNKKTLDYVCNKSLQLNNVIK